MKRCVWCVFADHSTAWMTGPTNVQARRIAPTVLEVTWDRPPYDAILGYRIYYDVYPEKDMDQWQSMEVGQRFATFSGP